jgi:hypothetical protein
MSVSEETQHLIQITDAAYPKVPPLRFNDAVITAHIIQTVNTGVQSSRTRGLPTCAIKILQITQFLTWYRVF